MYNCTEYMPSVTAFSADYDKQESDKGGVCLVNERGLSETKLPFNVRKKDDDFI